MTYYFGGKSPHEYVVRHSYSVHTYKPVLIRPRISVLYSVSPYTSHDHALRYPFRVSVPVEDVQIFVCLCVYYHELWLLKLHFPKLTRFLHRFYVAVIKKSRRFLPLNNLTNKNKTRIHCKSQRSICHSMP